jgi:hypothetical protein
MLINFKYKIIYATRIENIKYLHKIKNIKKETILLVINKNHF